MKQQLFFLAISLFTTVLIQQETKAQAGNTKYGSQALNSNTSGQYNSAYGLFALYSNTSGNSNTASGASALYNNVYGVYNCAYGVATLWSNTSGDWNSAYGTRALNKNTFGNGNSAYGALALYENTTGHSNSALGVDVLRNNTTGYQNTASGYQALYGNTTGYHNTASGYQALFINTIGIYNTALGVNALYSNSTGSNNTASGLNALFANTTASNNTASGVSALHNNTTGFNNTASGVSALHNNTTGFNNTASGVSALHNNTTGFNNTSIGNYSLRDNTTGARNTALGDSAGAKFNSTYSTFIGYKTSVTVTGLTNITVLGNHASATASNQVRIGNTSVTSIGGNVGWTTLSDGRFKRNINEDVPGLTFINKLRPVTYTLDIDGLDKASGASEQLTDEERVAKAAAIKEKHTGFVAQEVEKVVNDMKYDFGGVDKPKNDKDFYGLRYSEFVVPLVKAVQELSKKNDELQEENNNQQQQINELKNMVAMLANDQILNNNQNISASGYLEQNIPNPTLGNTTIRYHVPFTSTSAKLTITNIKGQLIKAISISNMGTGQVNLNSETFASGTYNYSLWVDGKQIDTKRLIISK